MPESEKFKGKHIKKKNRLCSLDYKTVPKI
jgi:hypothetical protein